MTAPVITMSKQKKELVPVKAGPPASVAKMLPTLWAGRGYEDFDDFESLGDKLLSQAARLQNVINRLEEAIGNNRVTQDHIDYVEQELAKHWSSREDIAEYQQMWDYWEHRELYEKLKKPKYNHKEVLVNEVIKAQRVALQVAGLYADYNLADDEAGQIRATVMVEDIKAARPSAPALESTCREVRRTENYIKFPPKVREVRELLAKHEDAWADRHPDNIDPENTKAELREVLAKAKQALIVQEEKARVAEAELARREAERVAAAEAEAERRKVEQARRNAELEELNARRVAEAEGQRATEAAIALCVENHGGTAALNSHSAALEGLLGSLDASQYTGADVYRVSYALGVFEMRRELRAWEQAWARNRFGLPIWA
jgi:hypothetical protein